MSIQYRADVVGSLLRPESLSKARSAFDNGELSKEELTAAQNEAVSDVVRMQRECGLPVVTDGELRRRTYTAPLTEGLRGLTEVEGRYMTWRDSRGNERTMRQPFAVTGKLELRESAAAGEYAYARSVSDAPVKVTVPSPLNLLSRWVPGISTAAYPDPFELFADTTQILRGIVAELVSLGCGYIQFDAPELTNAVDPEAVKDLNSRGIEAGQLLRTGCAMLNELADIGDGTTRFAVHLCRGNNNGMWRRAGGYESVIETLYEQTPNISVLMLEFDDERSGEFAALRDAPKGKTLVLGLVSTKVNQLESESVIESRIEQATKYVPIDQLALSTQCGFSSTLAGAPVDESTQRRKLSLIADIAARIWN